MVRGPYIDKNGLKKGAWSKEEDDKLRAYVLRYGHWNWRQLPKFAGLQRCGKSCRIRWLNYLNPDVKRGDYSKEEEDLIMNLFEKFGSKWSKIAEYLPGRTDNDIKNHWHAHLKKLQEQKQTTPADHELKEQTLAEFSQDDVFEELEAEISTPTITCNNLSHLVIFESCPFSPSISSSESSYLSSNSAMVNVSYDEDKSNYTKGAWNQEEDDKLRAYVQRHGLTNGWSEVPKVAGLSRSSKSCRIRWMNYLRPEVKRGSYSKEEEDLIIKLHEQLGNKWSAISAQLPGRTDNEIKNYWNTHLKKRREFNSQLAEIYQSDETNSNKVQLEDVDVVIDQTTQSPLLENIPLTPETSSSEFSFSSMDWFMEDTSNPFETFEADFWTEPFVLDTVGTKCGYDITSSMDWELLSTAASLYGGGEILPYSL